LTLQIIVVQVNVQRVVRQVVVQVGPVDLLRVLPLNPPLLQLNHQPLLANPPLLQLSLLPPLLLAMPLFGLLEL
jgi:hypothetical protein